MRKNNQTNKEITMRHIKHYLSNLMADIKRPTDDLTTKINRQLHYDMFTGVVRSLMREQEPKPYPVWVEIETVQHEPELEPYDQIHVHEHHVTTLQFKQLLNLHRRLQYQYIMSFTGDKHLELSDQYEFNYATKKQKDFIRALSDLQFVQIDPETYGKEQQLNQCFVYPLISVKLETTPNIIKQFKKPYSTLFEQKGFDDSAILLTYIDQQFKTPCYSKALNPKLIAKGVKKKCESHNVGAISLFVPKDIALSKDVVDQVYKLLDRNITIIREK